MTTYQCAAGLIRSQQPFDRVRASAIRGTHPLDTMEDESPGR